MAQRLRRRQDDDRTAGQAHASLRNRRDRKRILALQKPLSKLKPKNNSAAPDQAVQPRPASPDRALTGVPFTSSNRGPFYTKRRGPVSTVIDTRKTPVVFDHYKTAANSHECWPSSTTKALQG